MSKKKDQRGYRDQTSQPSYEARKERSARDQKIKTHVMQQLKKDENRGLLTYLLSGAEFEIEKKS